eukprot:gene4653-5945_t
MAVGCALLQNAGRVQVNGADVKPAREVKSGDTVTLRQGPVTRVVEVRAVSGTRAPATGAQQQPQKTPDSPKTR